MEYTANLVRLHVEGETNMLAHAPSIRIVCKGIDGTLEHLNPYCRFYWAAQVLRLLSTGMPGDFCISCEKTKLIKEELGMARGKKHTAEQVVNLLRQVEGGVANGKTLTQSCK